MRGNNHKQPLVIANWKMKLLPEHTLDLAKKIKKASAKYRDAEVVVCPSFTELGSVADILNGSSVALGAQDCFWEEHGAFTGETSPKQLAAYAGRK